jgi:hypothetical protein
MSDEWLFKSETYDNCNCAFHIALARPSGSFEFTHAEIGLGT